MQPDAAAALRGLLPLRLDGPRLIVAMGMMGAVVMPHNIYLHSNVIQNRDWSADEAARRRLIAFQKGDTVLAMGLGWLVNSAMLIVAAAVFFRNGVEVTSIEQASATLEPLVGHLARFVFALALLCAGVGSSLTSSMAEANVLTAYLGRPEDPRSFFYRASLVLTALPALVIVALQSDSYNVLILSQVALSIQLPFTIAPLLLLVGDRRVMGEYASGIVERTLAILAGLFVVVLNAFLLVQTIGGG